VKGVPYNVVFPTRTNVPNRSLIEKVRLANALKTGARKSIKRSPENNLPETNKRQKPDSSKKRKRTSPSKGSQKKQKTGNSPISSLTKKMNSLKI
jgi:hypothetical protein